MTYWDADFAVALVGGIGTPAPTLADTLTCGRYVTISPRYGKPTADLRFSFGLLRHCVAARVAEARASPVFKNASLRRSALYLR